MLLLLAVRVTDLELQENLLKVKKMKLSDLEKQSDSKKVPKIGRR